MTDENEQRSPSQRIGELHADFEEAMATHEASGEPLNVLLSQEVRECLEAYLKQSATVIIEAENAPLISEMVIGTAADGVPGIRRGVIREALMHYVDVRESEASIERIREEYENHEN